MNARPVTSGDTTTVADVEDSRLVLLPGQVSLKLLGYVRLATRRQADHDDDELRGDIALRNPSIGRDSGPGHARNIKCRCMRADSRGLAARILSTGHATVVSSYYDLSRYGTYSRGELGAVELTLRGYGGVSVRSLIAALNAAAIAGMG